MANIGLFSTILLNFVVYCVNKADSEMYWITTNSSSLRTAHLTLSQFAANSDDYLYPNTTLVFLPGTHYLTETITISNLVNFSMTSASTTVHLVCTYYSDNIHFNHSQYVHITKVEFIGCGGNLVNDVVKLVVQYVLFQGNEHSGGLRVLDLIDTTAQIVNCTFVSNGKGTVGGGIVANNCKVDIFQSTFLNNKAELGGAILPNNVL